MIQIPLLLVKITRDGFGPAGKKDEGVIANVGDVDKRPPREQGLVPLLKDVLELRIRGKPCHT
jgi:hypothetical protein